jgi:hypothetical protein
MYSRTEIYQQINEHTDFLGFDGGITYDMWPTLELICDGMYVYPIKQQEAIVLDNIIVVICSNEDP